MADVYRTASGNEYDFAADEVADLLYPRIKPVIGGDGEVSDLDYGQETMAGSLPVVIASDQSAVAVTPASLAVAVAVAAVTVGTSAAALPASALANRRTVTVYNNGSATIFLGPSGVLTTTGLPVTAGSAFSLDLAAGVVLYGISGSAGQDVRVLEVS
jgi:hypothetical protein